MIAQFFVWIGCLQWNLRTTGPDPGSFAGHFAKRTKARVQQIEEMLKTLEGLGKL